MKRIVWQGSSYDDLKAFPLNARQPVGQAAAWTGAKRLEPIGTVGRGVREIRIREDDGAFRVIYVANVGETIHVLHAFQKKSQKTSSKDLSLAKARYKAIER